MRSFNVSDEYDVKEANLIKAKQWQLDLLKLNPSYCCWGNFEDYMSGGSGWDKPMEIESFSEMFGLDELNECVNFYFGIQRKSQDCPHCEATGLNPATKRIDDDWYDFEHTGRRWDKNITDHEVKALVKGGRISELIPGNWKRFDEEKNCWFELDRSNIDNENPRGKWVECGEPQYPTAEQVNNWAKGRGLGHDAINKAICVRARAEREGVYGCCEHCNGDGREFLEDEAKVYLQLWILHPRKGCSRGVYIKNIQQQDLPKVYEFLKDAAKRNAERFSLIP